MASAFTWIRNITLGVASVPAIAGAYLKTVSPEEYWHNHDQQAVPTVFDYPREEVQDAQRKVQRVIDMNKENAEWQRTHTVEDGAKDLKAVAKGAFTAAAAVAGISVLIGLGQAAGAGVSYYRRRQARKPSFKFDRS